MDPHPTPFPGKRRALPKKKTAPAAANVVSKAAPPAPSLTARRNRAFGVPRGTNIPAPKPPPSEASKPSKPPRAVDRPWRISAAAKKPVECVKKPDSEPAGVPPAMAVPDDGGSTPTMSPQSVEPAKECTKKSPSESTGDPASDIGIVETPFLTAKRCNRCKAAVDRLELSSYWISQIELAASVGKHFASATFFRLAMDCRAEPFSILQDKLKDYIMEHGLTSTDSLWAALIEAYGLPHEPPIRDHTLPRRNLPSESNARVTSAVRGHSYAVSCQCSEGSISPSATTNSKRRRHRSLALGLTPPKKSRSQRRRSGCGSISLLRRRMFREAKKNRANARAQEKKLYEHGIN